MRKRQHVELYQAEWCPHSHKVRQRLTELGLDFRARQVPADPDDREQMQRVIGTDEIPVLVADDDERVCGEDEILEYLSRFEERHDAEMHRAKAREEVPTFAEVRAPASRSGRT
jgi:glutaredoxin